MQCYAEKKFENDKTENVLKKKSNRFSSVGSDFGYSRNDNTNFFGDVTVQRAAAFSLNNETVVQCWKTKSLEEETCPSSGIRSGSTGEDADPQYAVGYKLAELRGLGLAAAQAAISNRD